MLKQKIIYQLDPGAYQPVKAHEADAGFDCTGEEVFNHGRETTTD